VELFVGLRGSRRFEATYRRRLQVFRSHRCENYKVGAACNLENQWNLTPVEICLEPFVWHSLPPSSGLHSIWHVQRGWVMLKSRPECRLFWQVYGSLQPIRAVPEIVATHYLIHRRQFIQHSRRIMW